MNPSSLDLGEKAERYNPIFKEIFISEKILDKGINQQILNIVIKTYL